MNGIEGLILGFMSGSVATYFFFIMYAKYMNKELKEDAIGRAKAKWGQE